MKQLTNKDDKQNMMINKKSYSEPGFIKILYDVKSSF